MKGRQDTTLMQGRNFTEIGESRWYIIYITEEYIYDVYSGKRKYVHNTTLLRKLKKVGIKRSCKSF